MESQEVKRLREIYGIYDSENEYNKEQIIQLSNMKLFYFKPHKNEDTKDIFIEKKEVPGYISKNNNNTIFIKDMNITKMDDIFYYPVTSITKCKKIKNDIYMLGDTIFCFNYKFKFCIDYIVKYLKNNIKEQISNLENIKIEY